MKSHQYMIDIQVNTLDIFERMFAVHILTGTKFVL